MSSVTYFYLRDSRSWCCYSSLRSLLSRSLSYIRKRSLSCRFNYAFWRCFSSSSHLSSVLSSLSFIIAICSYKLAKFSVSMLSFSWRQRSVFSELCSCTSKELITRDFSASMSSSTCISVSIYAFCLYISSKSISSFLLANYSLVSPSVKTELFYRCLTSSTSNESSSFLNSLFFSSK